VTFAHLVTFLLGMAAQLLLGGRRANETSLTDHITDIAALRGAATDYWLAEGSDTIEAELLQAAKVQVALAAVTAFASVAERYFDQVQLDEYSNQVRELNRSVTGGEFETVGRAASPATAIEVARQCASITHYLRNSRSSLYGLMPIRARNGYGRHAPAAKARLIKEYSRIQQVAKNGVPWKRP
jgi:hypothetical protein